MGLHLDSDRIALYFMKAGLADCGDYYPKGGVRQFPTIFPVFKNTPGLIKIILAGD